MRHVTPHHRARLATLRRSVPSPYAAALTARRAFTLIELLVVIGIILLVAAITLSAVNLSISGDRIRGAARQTQSYLEGARSRAVYGGSDSTKGPGYQCGVRFIRESTDFSDPRYWLVSTMQYVELDPDAATISGLGTDYSFARVDDLPAPNGDGMADSADILRLVSANPSNTNWTSKYQYGLIYPGQTILINSRKYQIDVSKLAERAGGAAIPEEIRLLSAFESSAISSLPSYSAAAVEALNYANNPLSYKIFLRPQPMANQEPRSLGNGVVIDLKVLSLPQYGMSKGLSSFGSGQDIDIMFSPRGTVVGRLSGTGIVEFVLSDREDALKSIGLTETSKRERLIVSLKPQTGMTAVHPVYVAPPGDPADPYRYSETGEVARQ